MTTDLDFLTSLASSLQSLLTSVQAQITADQIINPPPPPPPAGQTFNVTGSSVPDLTGAYVVTGTQNGSDYYKGPNGYMWVFPGGGGYWIISPDLGVQTNDFYATAVFSGSDSVPTIGSYAPQNGATGSLSVALASSEPIGGSPPPPVATAAPGSNIVTSGQQSSVTFPTVENMTLQMTLPVLTNVSTVVFDSNNLTLNSSPPVTHYGDAITDTQMMLPVSNSVQFSASVGSLVKNVAVYMHGVQVFSAVPSSGVVSGVIDMTASNRGGAELNGPCVMDIYAWDSAPGTSSTTGYLCKQRVMFFITGGSDYAAPTPIGAAGMTIAFEDDFTAPLSVSSTDTTAKWYPAQTFHAGGGGFGDAIFQDPENLNGGPNPFTQLGTFLRIRLEHSLNVTDPGGWGRKVTTGFLSTAFPGGTAGFYAALPYYAECRMLCPIGGVPWPAFWQNTRNGLINGDPGGIETDTVEIIGIFPPSWRSGGILYAADGSATQTGNGPTNSGNQPGTFSNDGAFWDFHTFGVLVTDTTTTFYMDNVETGSYPTPALPSNLSGTGPREDFFMVDNAYGGGGWTRFESQLPNSAWYDMWVDFVKVYRP